MTRLLHRLFAAVATVLVVATFLPLIQTEWWAVRLLDFPRLQIGMALVALGCVLVCFLRRAPWMTGALLTGVVVAVIGHALILWPYRPNAEVFPSGCADERKLSVMVANVLLGNRTSAPLLSMVEREQPDLFLAMETDEWWDEALRPLKRTMPYSVEKITGSYYGMHFFSRLPLIDPEIRFLANQGTPSVITGVTLRDGERVDFLGTHPKPPLVWQSSLGRDAELYSASLLMRDWAHPGILAGDLNSTPWEEAVDRSRRIAHLIDPRRGYGYVPTFSAKSPIKSWPLDQTFHQGGFATMSLKRLDAFGSDHYPYIVRLCRQTAGETPPRERSGDLARARDILARAGATTSPGNARSSP